MPTPVTGGRELAAWESMLCDQTHRAGDASVHSEGPERCESYVQVGEAALCARESTRGVEAARQSPSRGA